MTFAPSKFQQDIFSFIQNGTGNAIIEAVAGSGKSTTIVEGMGLLPDSSRPIFLAFNKSIAEELKARGVNARTFHSLCYSPVLNAVGARKVNDQKINQLIRSELSESQVKTYANFVRKLVGLARQVGAGCLTSMDSSVFMALVEHHELETDSDSGDEMVGISLAIKILEASNASNEVDFDDLLYFAVSKGVRLPSYDWVFVDEAQDTNQIQRAILRKILAKGGRLIAVGDAAQAIYGFRGADSDALELIAKDFAPCVRLPLSVTYRCPLAVVEQAQRYVPAIAAADNAVQGEVRDYGTDWSLRDLGAKDLVVCRNTKPLIDLGFKLMRARIPLRILGRDLGEGLISLIRKCDAGRGIEAFENKLQTWRERESEKAIAKGLDAKAEAVQDKADTILMLVHELPEHKRTTAELITIIQALFADHANCVTLSTIHKAKGMEACTVWWLESSMCPSRWARQPWQKQQEDNLIYVTITRAKKSLFKIDLTDRIAA